MLRPSFEPLVVGTGVAVVDPIERHRYALSTPNPVSTKPIDGARFRAPVDAAVAVDAREIALPSVPIAHVTDDSGTILTEIEHFAYEEFPTGVHTVELSAPIKLYVRVEGTLTVAANAERMRLHFGDGSDVSVGARSHHERPATTVTTTGEPRDVMRAVSTFASALKTTSPERSYPTLRGHPPALAPGDALRIPEGLEPPATGVEIALPPDLGAVYAAAPLAYYLGATLVPGERPAIRTDRGFEHPLDSDRGFESELKRVLEGTFLLDCLVRTEGLTPVDLHERRALEPELDLDLAALYDRSLAARLETYLDVPFDLLEPHVPDWKRTAYVEPVSASLETLPYLVDDLALIRARRPAEIATTPDEMGLPTPPPSLFGASAHEVGEGGHTDDGDATRSIADGAGESSRYVRPEPTDSLEATWVGEGIPFGASKSLLAAHRNRFDREPSTEDIAVTVVCNDAEMGEERRTVVEEVYGSREEVPFEVAVHRDTTTDELRDLLAARTDFLHYIGHVDDEGFECADGRLDVRALDAVGVDAFLLNACWSYWQGVALIERGAIAGITTLTDVINVGAIGMGKTLSRLLNAGFPMGIALEIAAERSIVGDEYIAIGEENLSIAQAGGTIPQLYELERSGDEFKVEIRTYPAVTADIGSIYIPTIKRNDEYYLASGKIPRFILSRKEVEQLFMADEAPIRLGRKIRWSGRIDFDEV
ncbi:hypothetical protein BRC90_09870 [Halobacteriales archaeon QS_4_69_34]|nr:MAG: hypothetical protein BRC90_09870 [Halobacteriales archaeon QS_4_69_34]